MTQPWVEPTQVTMNERWSENATNCTTLPQLRICTSKTQRAMFAFRFYIPTDSFYFWWWLMLLTSHYKLHNSLQPLWAINSTLYIEKLKKNFQNINTWYAKWTAYKQKSEIISLLKIWVTFMNGHKYCVYIIITSTAQFTIVLLFWPLMLFASCWSTYFYLSVTMMPITEYRFY